MLYTATPQPTGTPRQCGLTLLEMLVTVSILAAVAAIGLQVLRGVDQDSKLRLAQAEMQQIAKAIRRFEQDTGYRSRIVGYATSDLNRCGARANGADFGFLFVAAPYGNSDQDGCKGWSLETASGWNGPYLTGSKRRPASIDVDDDSNTANDISLTSLTDGLQTGGENYLLPNGNDRLAWQTGSDNSNQWAQQSWPYIFYSETDFNGSAGFRHLRASGLDREFTSTTNFSRDECGAGPDDSSASDDQILCF